MGDCAEEVETGVRPDVPAPLNLVGTHHVHHANGQLDVGQPGGDDNPLSPQVYTPNPFSASTRAWISMTTSCVSPLPYSLLRGLCCTTPSLTWANLPPTDWPRDTQKHSKWPMFLQMHGSILPKMILPLLAVGGWATCICCVSVFAVSRKWARHVRGRPARPGIVH